VWEDKRSGGADIYAQKILSNGAMAWSQDGVSVCAAAGDQLTPSVAVDEIGASYVAWDDRRPGATGGSDIYLQRVLPDGSATFGTDGIMVSVGSQPNVTDHGAPVVAVTGNDRCLVAFHEGFNLYVNKVLSDGQLAWSSGKFVANVSKDASNYVSIVGDGADGAMLAWVFWRRDTAECSFVDHVGVQRLNHAGDRVWGGDNECLQPAISGFSDRPLVLKDDSNGFLVCWRQGTSSCAGEDLSQSDIAVQRYDSTGCPMWGKGLVVAKAANAQNNAAIAPDLLSGLVVCWTDARVPSENRVYVARVNDTPQMFEVSGYVRDPAGAGVAKAEVSAVDGEDVLVARMSAGDGYYVLGVPAFWRGDIHVNPRGYLNTATPSGQTVGPMLAPAVRNFTVRHHSTQWQDGGLGVLDDASEVASRSATTDAAGNLVMVWGSDEQLSGPGDGADVDVQRVDPSGDILWTTGGDRVVSFPARDELPVAVPSGPSDFILLWRRAAEFQEEGPYSGGLWAQRYSEPTQGQWGDYGTQVVADLDIAMFSACSDLEGGAYVCWFDEDWCWLRRIRGDGTLDWPEPVKLGGAGASPPIMEPDGVGGVFLSWQYISGQVHLYVQRVDPTGEPLWGGPQPWNPVTVRAGFVNMDPGVFRMVGDGIGGAFVAWSETSEPDSYDERIRVSWVYNDGAIRSGSSGAELTSGGARRMMIDDLALDADAHFFVTYTEIDESGTSRVIARRLTPGYFGGVWDLWGTEPKVIVVATDASQSRVFGRDPNGGCLVLWREIYDLKAKRLNAQGNPVWVDREYLVANDVSANVQAVSDRAGGAYISWQGTSNGIEAARVNEAVVANSTVNVSAFVRYANGVTMPIDGRHASGCPKGDADKLVFRIEYAGDVTQLPSPSSITLGPPSGTGVKFHRAEFADSALWLDGDHYRTTITVSEFSGCGTDSSEIKINDWLAAKARFTAASPDMVGAVIIDLADFANFTTFYKSSKCNCGVYPKAYSMCADFALPDSVVELSDFGMLGSHNQHTFGGGAPAPSVGTSSSGSVNLIFEELQVNGERRLRVRVVLEGAEAFSAAYLALKNENPRLRFAEWKQDPDYPYLTICADVTRDGRDEVALGVLGSKTPVETVNLGWIDLVIDSEAPLELSNEDLALVIGQILDVGGDILGVSGRGRSFQTRRYGNWLAQNFPNPFNPTTTIPFSMTTAGHVSLVIYDVTGAVVRGLINSNRKPNLYRVVWDGTNNDGSPVASGIYFYRLKAPGFTASRKMLLLK
jgi:hypothetical protein